MAATEFVPNQAKTEAITAHVIWLTTGLSCEGDSVAMTGATNPSLEDIITGAIPGMPRVVVHNTVLAVELGEEFMQAWYDAEAGKLDPFVLILEGSVPNEKINGDGYWTGMGVNPENGQPITTNEWIDRLAPKAAAVVAVGTCATYGGIPAMKNNPTGRDGPGGLPRLELEVQGRHPDRQHPRLPGPGRQRHRDADVPRVRARGHGAAARARRAAAAEVAVRAHGARGLQPRRLLPSRATSRPSTARTTAAWSSSAARARWSSATCRCAAGSTGIGGCPNVGGICMACTMPGFPDKYMPFMDPDPWGSAAASNFAAVHLRPAPPLHAQAQPRAASSTRNRSGVTTEPELTTGYAKRW